MCLFFLKTAVVPSTGITVGETEKGPGNWGSSFPCMSRGDAAEAWMLEAINPPFAISNSGAEKKKLPLPISFKYTF